jgi:hypothetical protein
MSFGDEVRSFAVAVQARNRRVFVNTASAVKDSITDGSNITGAPGQPVKSGVLKGSWILEFLSPTEARISSGGAASAYNWQIEDGISWRGQPLTLRSAVGGFHSVKLTVLNFDRLVAVEAGR